MSQQFKSVGTLVDTPYSTNHERADIWSCTYSPNGEIFAWSNGDGYVKLIGNWPQSNTRKQILIHRKKLNEKQRQQQQQQQQQQQIYANGDTGGEIGSSLNNNNDYDKFLLNDVDYKIDCGECVWSIAFGSSKSQLKHDRSQHKTSVNTRFKLNEQLILAVGLESGKIRIYDAYTRAFLFALCDHKGVVKDLKFTKNGSFLLASVSRDETVKLWNMLDDGNMFKTLTQHTGGVNAVDWSPTASLLCTVGVQRQAFIWDTETYKVKHSLKGHMNDVVDCQFSPDGALLATASFDTKVFIWNPYNGQIITQFFHLLPPPRVIYASGHNGAYVRSLCFNQTGSQLVTICEDKKIRVWSLNRRLQTPICEDEDTEAACCVYSPDNQSILIGTRNGNIDIYDAPTNVYRLVDICRKVVNQYIERDKVEKLQLPKELVNFLLYEDIRTVNKQS